MISKSYKSTHLLVRCTKGIILLGIGYWLYSHFNAVLFENPAKEIYSILTANLSNIAILVLYTVFNWLIECIKWHSLIKNVKTEPIGSTFYESIKQVFTAHTVSVITPAKLGAYGAKALYFASNKRKGVIALHFFGSASQMIPTTIFGIIGLLTVGNSLISASLRWPFIALIVILCLIAICLSTFRNKIEEHYKIPLDISKNIAFRVIALSFGRYLIFSHQLYFLLYLAKSDIGYFNTMLLIGIYYLFNSLLPVFQLLDVAIKSSVALLVFGSLNISASTLVIIPVIMWLFNAILPVLAGILFVLKWKPLKKNKLAPLTS